MRILHVLDHSVPLHSGYTFRTLALMREQQRRGWEPLLMTGPKQGSGDVLEEQSDGWSFYRTPPPAGRAAGLPVLGEFAVMRAIRARLDALVEQLEPDVIHAHSPVLNGIPALRVARRHNLPLVYEVRAFWEDAAVEHGTSAEGSARYRATRAAETYVLKRADAVTTICGGLRGAIVARGVAPERVTIIANAVDVERFTTDQSVDNALAETLGLADQWVLGFAGSFYRYEGLDIAIRAMAQPAIRARPIKLLLVGGGPETERLQALARELDVTDNVIFTGRVPHDDIARYYGLMDLLVFPRLRHRLTELVTPLKPLEAMAQGKLVAASDVGGHRELIHADETGLLFAPESPDALARCVLDVVDAKPAWLNHIRANGRRFVETERTWGRSASAYAAVYDAVTASASAWSHNR